MEKFIEDLKKNRCTVVSLCFESPSVADVKVRPPHSSENVGKTGLQTLPNHPLFMLKLRQGTEVSYTEAEPGLLEVRVEHPRKPFTEEGLREIAQRQGIQFIVCKNGNANKSSNGG